MPTFGSLFAGIGGMDLGLERAGWECRWQVEWDEWCQRVLAKHWPDVRRYGDITQLTGYELEPVDLVAGGFPCQPVSKAGRRKAQEDDRWLWPEYARLLRALRPPLALLENVPGLLNVNRGRAFGEVAGDLAEIGYHLEWDCIPASAVGARHRRDRFFGVAYSDDSGRFHGQAQVFTADAGLDAFRESQSGGADVADANGSSRRPAGSAGEEVHGPETVERPGRRGGVSRHSWAVEPDVGRVANGIPDRVDRLRGLGNSVVPQVAEWIGRRLMEVA